VFLAGMTSFITLSPGERIDVWRANSPADAA
jgi:hypothetical protein